MANNEKRMVSAGEYPSVEGGDNELGLSAWLKRFRSVSPFFSGDFRVFGLILMGDDAKQIALKCGVKAGDYLKLDDILQSLHDLGVIGFELGGTSDGFDRFFLIVSVEALKKAKEMEDDFVVEFIDDIRGDVDSVIN